MTEEQRVKLEELITELEQVVSWSRNERDKARDRITDHLTLIQYNNALYNFQRFGVKDLEDLDLREWEKKSPVSMEDGVTIREIAIWTLTKHRDAVGDHLDLSDEELQNLFRRLCAHDPVRFERVLEEFSSEEK